MQRNVCKSVEFYIKLLLCGFLDCLERFVADVMLDLAGICRCDLSVHTEGHEEIGKQSVTVVNLACNGKTAVGKREVAVLVHTNVSALLQKADSSAYAGLGEAHIFAHVDRSHVRIFLRKH